MYKKYFKESIESHELFLYITNDGQLYKQATNIINNMKKKLKAGKFDPTLAVKGFFYLADAGAKKYEKDFGDKFSKSVKMETAKELLDYYMGEIKEKYKECDCDNCKGDSLDEDQKRCDDLGKEKGRKYKYDGGTCELQSCGTGEVWNDDRTRCVKKESLVKEGKINFKKPINLFLVFSSYEERGSASVDVSTLNGETVWSWNSDDEETQFGDELRQFTGMKHLDDMYNCEKYLKQMKIIPKNAFLYDSEDKAEKEYKKSLR